MKITDGEGTEREFSVPTPPVAGERCEHGIDYSDDPEVSFCRHGCSLSGLPPPAGERKEQCAICGHIEAWHPCHACCPCREFVAPPAPGARKEGCGCVEVVLNRDPLHVVIDSSACKYEPPAAVPPAKDDDELNEWTLCWEFGQPVAYNDRPGKHEGWCRGGRHVHVLPASAVADAVRAMREECIRACESEGYRYAAETIRQKVARDGGCESKLCNAPVLYLTGRTPKGRRKLIPVNAPPRPRWVERDGVAELVDTYEPHAETCLDRKGAKG